MTARNNRAQSSASVSVRSAVGVRPTSSASTTSRHSFDQHDLHAQFQHSQHRPTPPPASYSQQLQYTSSFAGPLLQAAQHVSQQENVSMDPVHQLVGFVGDGQTGMGPTHGLPLQHIDPNAQQSFQSSQTQPQQFPVEPQQFVATPIEVDDKKKKNGGPTAQNDKELREMLRHNQGRKLKEVAAEVLATDRTSRSEKSKQLFAMLWLQQACTIGKTSVPRNRVFSKYASRCAHDRVVPLNPASFGKLVRVIFPNIQTRRLGVRGESKYHYVDLEMVDDVDEAQPPRHMPRVPTSRGALKRHDSTASQPRMSADTAAFPAHQQQSYSTTNYYPQNSSKGRCYADIHSSQTAGYEYELRFPTPELLNNVEGDPLEITMPDVSPYLPEGTDPDTSEALAALYKSHITSLVDAVRFCKEKQFFRLFTSFQGTLTVPVAKLFALDKLSPWIRECDWMMYQKMIRNVAQLTLQVAPAPVLKFLDNVWKLLHSHINKAFHNLPSTVLAARLEPATVFSHLLRQMLRVNSTAHAAAVMLTVDENRDRMWGDYQAYVNIKRIMENELPHSCNHELVAEILSKEIRAIFLPLKSEMWLPDGTFYQISTPDPAVDILQETVIDRIAAFLTRLPSRFPDLSARTVLHTLNAISTAILREITVENGPSFQGWWLTKVFVDEMAIWLASLGGFLSHQFPVPDPISPGILGESMNAGMATGSSGSQNQSRFGSEEFGTGVSFMGGNGSASMHGQNMSQPESKCFRSLPF
jgi:regulatory factor X